MRPDLEQLRAHHADLSDLLDHLEIELVDDPRWSEPSDTSYLSAEDRANPDILANVEAMTATNLLISWFARDREGYVGLWRGPSDTPLASAPIVRLDTEGQYDLVALTVPDWLVSFYDEEDDETADELAALRERLANLGLPARASLEEIDASIAGLSDPQDFRHELYNAGRVKRGLSRLA